MLTQEQVRIVNGVHRRIFGMFTYKTDLEKYKVLEHWADVTDLSLQISSGRLVGDCDDFALACRYLLNEAGVPNRLVFCVVDGEGHCVCEAEGYILDNMQTSVVRIDQLPEYKFIKMSGYKPGDPWTLIQD
jgi:predicted transglutaminase-like cysteine proteinase